jgi:hypothetical protein
MTFSSSGIESIDLAAAASSDDGKADCWLA